MIRVGVMRGGMSDEYEVSLRTGAQVLEAISRLPQDKYKALDMLVTRNGDWHLNGLPVTLEKLKESVDIVWNALHGGSGEDGTLASFLHRNGIPYTGSHAFPSALAMEKNLAKKKVKMHGIKVPQDYIVNPYDTASGISISDYATEQAGYVFRSAPPPWIVKPVSGGSSLGIVLARTLPELGRAISKALSYGDALIVEEFIEGKEATAGVVEGLRGEELYALVPIEILKDKKEMYDYFQKYSLSGRTVVGGSFTAREKEMLQVLARSVHQLLGLRHYSRSDFVINPRGEVYFIEVNSLPGLTEHSLVPQALSAVGVSMSQFVEHVLDQAVSEYSAV